MRIQQYNIHTKLFFTVFFVVSKGSGFGMIYEHWRPPSSHRFFLFWELQFDDYNENKKIKRFIKFKYIWLLFSMLSIYKMYASSMLFTQYKTIISIVTFVFNDQQDGDILLSLIKKGIIFNQMN